MSSDVESMHLRQCYWRTTEGSVDNLYSLDSGETWGQQYNGNHSIASGIHKAHLHSDTHQTHVIRSSMNVVSTKMAVHLLRHLNVHVRVAQSIIMKIFRKYASFHYNYNIKEFVDIEIHTQNFIYYYRQCNNIKSHNIMSHVMLKVTIRYGWLVFLHPHSKTQSHGDNRCRKFQRFRLSCQKQCSRSGRVLRSSTKHSLRQWSRGAPHSHCVVHAFINCSRTYGMYSVSLSHGCCG